MRKPMTVKTLRYHSLLIIGFAMGLIFLFISAILGAKDYLSLIIGSFYFIFLMIARYFCMGQFVAQEIENNRMTINWIRKPLFSDESDLEIDLLDLAEVKVFNDFLSHTPDKFYLRTNAGESMSFHIPIFGIGNQFNRFNGILGGAAQVSNKKV